MKEPLQDQTEQTRLYELQELCSLPKLPTGLTETYADHIIKQLSRRNMLRNSVLAATGAVLLPSFITGCRKDNQDLATGPGPNPGAVLYSGLTLDQLAQAAANLTALRQLVIEVYNLSAQYDEAVFHALASTKEHESWTNFIVDLFIDIALAIIGAGAIITGNPEIMPSFALIAAVLKDWGIGKDKPTDLNGVFASFEFGHIKMQFELEQKLSSLADPSNNYNNLRTAWTNEIEFNGKKYTLGDLASTKIQLGDDYNKLQATMYTSLKQSIWNLAIMKCCTYHAFDTFSRVVSLDTTGERSIVDYARKSWYTDTDSQHYAHYLRAVPSSGEAHAYTFQYWSLGLDGNSFPEEACNELFKDSTPYNIINPDGLFYRSYVFQQFAMTKPVDFLNWHELSTYIDDNFAPSDDWEFTGGVFPRLTKK